MSPLPTLWVIAIHPCHPNINGALKGTHVPFPRCQPIIGISYVVPHSAARDNFNHHNRFYCNHHVKLSDLPSGGRHWNFSIPVSLLIPPCLPPSSPSPQRIGLQCLNRKPEIWIKSELVASDNRRDPLVSRWQTRLKLDTVVLLF